MNIFENKNFDNHEQIIFCQEPKCSLQAIIAVHDTRLGPAIGGCRMYPYATIEDAIDDVLKLSRGMTYKSAINNFNFGGGKAVIIGDPIKFKSEAMFRTFGRFVDGLNGRYITAEDLGTDVKCMEWVRIETKHVVGLPTYIGGLGDPSPVTAHGVLIGIKACLKNTTGNENLKDVQVAIQGVGHVGYYLCKELHEQGAKLYVSDINKSVLKNVSDEFKVTVIDPDEIYGLNVDIFAPCALGGIINDDTIPQLKCSIVAGAANNPLMNEEKHGIALHQRNILYAPDYIINAGGLIDAASEFFHAGKALAWAKTEEIYDTLMQVFNYAKENDTSPVLAAKQLAELRINAIKHSQNVYTRRGKSRR
ncbi:MAG: leucine dehydrogenase [Coxiella sp. DG_40]|nr:MAG: leucine dehydrogenase [Coxiella sp. DG_40]